MASVAFAKRIQTSKWPFRLLIFYIAIDFLRPQDTFHIIGTLRLPGFIALALFLYWFRKQKLTSVFGQQLLKLNAVFVFLIGFSVVYSVNTYHPTMRFIQCTWMTLALVMPMLLIVDNKQKLLALIRVWVVIHGFLALLVIKHGGTGSGGFLMDENDVALALVMSLPYAVYLFSYETSKKWKIIAAASALIEIFAVAYSFSRGGFLGLLCVLLTIFFFSEKKFKHASLTAVFLLVFGSLLIGFLPDSYFDEMETSTDYQSGTGEQRMVSWDIGLQMFYDNPLWGVGAENYPWNVEKYQYYSKMWDPNAMRSLAGRQAHSLYFTLIPEFGLIGSSVYISMLVIIFRRLLAVMRRYKNDTSKSEYVFAAKAIIVSMVGYLTAGAFISVLYYPHFWYFLALTLVVLNLVKHDEP